MCSSAEEGIFLTGLGLYSDPQLGAFIAPPDSSARWDDPGYENPIEHQFGVMNRRDVNGKHGFIFHDDCWSLVKQAYHPAPVPLERLYNVIDSLSMHSSGARVDWGHSYGGFGVELGAEKDHLPWERGLVDYWFLEDPFDVRYTTSPLALSEVNDILAEPPANTQTSGPASIPHARHLVAWPRHLHIASRRAVLRYRRLSPDRRCPECPPCVEVVLERVR